MKEINPFIVESVMNSLIHTNKKTTPLAVEEILLTLGYHASLKDVTSAITEIILHSECISTYEVTYKDHSMEIRFNENSSIMTDHGTAKEYKENQSLSNKNHRAKLRNEVIDYFLFDFEKIVIKEMASGELYIKPYTFSNKLNFDQTVEKVLKDLKQLPITIDHYVMEPPFIEDDIELPEFMIEFNV